ncbi:AI-2E family transporter [Patescibacteria group bacterium]
MSKNYRLEFYVLLLILGIATLYIAKSYLGMFMVSFILAMIFDPLYKKLTNRLKNETIASILTTLIVFFVVILPFVFVGSIAVKEAVSFADSLRAQETISQLQNIGKKIEEGMPRLVDQIQVYVSENDIDLRQTIISLAKSTSGFLSSSIVPLAQVGVSSVMGFVIFVFILIYTFPIKDDLVKYLLSISPVSKNESKKLGVRFGSIVNATIKGTIAIALVQGLLGGIMLWILGVPAPVLWGSLMAVFSIIPLLGSAIVWLPISIILMLTGQLVHAIVLILWGVLVISSVDNVVRPKLMGKGDAKMPELLTLISVLGGIKVFGFFGFIYGPVIVALFVTMLNMYKRSLSSK